MKYPQMSAALLLLGAPLARLAGAVQTDGRAPGSIPNIEVPERPEWKDIDHPAFEPYPVEKGAELQDNAIFEQFSDSDDEIWQRWKKSTALRSKDEPYTGEWAIEEPHEFRGFDGDRGLVLKSEQQAAAVARKLETPISTSKDDGKPWVVQYEVKLQKPLRCGGAYLKLLPTTDSDDWSAFSNETPYLVMFGPDKCGQTDKVHFILRRNGVEHHLVGPPRPRSGLLSTLYTLIVNPDQTYEIRVDGDILRSGSLQDDSEFEPSLLPPSEIEDPNDTKPEDWVEEEMIPDPNETTKPEDWDEEAPYLISDPEATKPAKWREDTPLFVPDPEAKRPEFWDDEEDGEWTAPEILNPECADLDSEAGEGCGEWTPPLIRNPEFRGKWSRPLIENPDYKGPWEPRKIANPEFKPETDRPSVLDGDIGGIGFELLTVQGDILFDNIYIGRSVRDAENLGNATWSPKFLIENESQSRATEAYKKANAEASDNFYANTKLVDRYLHEFEDFKLDPWGYTADTYNAFLDQFRENKLEALKVFPVTALAAFTVGCVVTAVVFGIFNVLLVLLTGGSRKKTAPKLTVTDATVTTNDTKTGDSTTEKITEIRSEK